MQNMNKGKTDIISQKDKEPASGIEIIPDLENLRSYSQIRLALGEMMRIIHQAFITLGREEAKNQCEELLVKLAEDRFTLAVLGEFKRGKSSLMNAIIGKEILPTGVLPLTSAITVLKYGAKERLLIDREGGLYSSEVPIGELSDYVTEKGNPQNQKKVKTAYLELPVPFLRYGLEFVDTPGVGSAIVANTETTYKFLPSCDAVLFVTSVDTPLTTDELEFLNNIKEYVSKIFFIVNKIDLITESEKEEIITFLSQTIKSNVGIDIDKIFPVSCKLALDARAPGYADEYEASGLKTLEDSFASFLTEEKSETFLAAVMQKILRILESEKSENIFEENFLKERAAWIANEKVRTIHDDPYKAAAIVSKIKSNLETFYKTIEGGKVEISNISSSQLRTSAVNQNDVSVIESTKIKSAKSAENINLKKNLQVRGCSVCGHIADQAFDFFAHWQYELSSNENAQNEFAKQFGFCPLHTWQLLSISSPQGASIGFARFAEEAGERLKNIDWEQAKGEIIRKWVHNSKSCPACKFLRQREHDYIMKLITSMQTEEGKKLYANSDSACLHHLSMLLEEADSKDTGEFLLHHAIEKFEHDAEDMRSFALKNEALRRYLQNDNEKDAYLRTIIRIVGEHNVCMPWAQDGEI